MLHPFYGNGTCLHCSSLVKTGWAGSSFSFVCCFFFVDGVAKGINDVLVLSLDWLCRDSGLREDPGRGGFTWSLAGAFFLVPNPKRDLRMLSNGSVVFRRFFERAVVGREAGGFNISERPFEGAIVALKEEGARR